MIDTSMWKSDRLISLLRDDSRFEPIVISYLFPEQTTHGKMLIERQIREFCADKGYEYECGFDFASNSLIHIDAFDPDIVFYPQPYHENPREFPTRALMAYIPYCFEVENERAFHNWLYQNICWKMFMPNEYLAGLERKYNVSRGFNTVVTGYPLADYFFDGHLPESGCWKDGDHSKKRIIWAPHHSILKEDTLDYSLFLDMADDMLELAKEYKDRVLFAFKPHPVLRDKLNRHPDWGVEKTDAYYREWEHLPNTSLASGEYVDLFLSSDALIHDCSSFTVEYLYVNKPVLFLSKTGMVPVKFNEFARSCYDVHYHGTSIDDVRRFIADVIDGRDSLVQKRSSFVSRALVPSSGSDVGKAMYDEICRLVD